MTALEEVLDGSRASDLESSRLDFKEDPSSTSKADKSVRDAAIWFANADGGTVVLGIRDEESGQAAFVGTALDVQALQRRIYELTEPSLLVNGEEISFAGVRLILLRVPRSLDIHADTSKADCYELAKFCSAPLNDQRRGSSTSIVQHLDVGGQR